MLKRDNEENGEQCTCMVHLIDARYGEGLDTDSFDSGRGHGALGYYEAHVPKTAQREAGWFFALQRAGICCPVSGGGSGDCHAANERR